MTSVAAGGSSRPAAARVSIPSNVKKTIQNIKEITGNHSDEEIYAMLRECSMDPNETAQKLLFQDTFHEVKRKRDRRKENMNKEPTEARFKAGMQGRVSKGGRGSFSSRYISNDLGGGRNPASGKETGANFQETKNKETSATVSLSTIAANGAPSVASGQYERTGPDIAKSEGTLPVAPHVDLNKSPPNDSGTRDTSGLQMLDHINCSTSIASASSSGSHLSASDPVLLPSLDARLPGAVGTIRREAGSHRVSVGQVLVDVESKTTSASEVINTKLHGKKSHKSQGIGKNQLMETSQTVSSIHIASINRPSSNNNSCSQVIGPQKGSSKEWKPKSSSSNVAHGMGSAASVDVPADSVEANIHLLPVSSVVESNKPALELQRKLEETHISDGQHVKIPNHLHVPETEKLDFCFGSFDASFSLGASYSNGLERLESSPVSEASEGSEETMKAQISSGSNQDTVALAEEGDYHNQPESSVHDPEHLSSNEGEAVSTVAPDYTEPKQEATQIAHQDTMLHSSPNYNFGFISPILSSQIAPLDNSQSQAHNGLRLPNFAVPQGLDPSSYYAQYYCSGTDTDGRASPLHSTGVAAKHNGNASVVPQSSQSAQEGVNSLGLSSTAPTPLAAQAAGLMQSSLNVTQQPVPVFRQSPGVHLSHYPTNYIPYGPFFSPFYIPPAAMHQFLSNGAFPQPQAGSMYLPPPAVTAKYSLPQYKPGTNAGNSSHIGAAASFGPYGASMANYTPGGGTTSGNQTSNNDLAVSQFKESNIYSSGQQTEGSGVWITPPGRDMSSLQAGSFYNLPQGQVAFTPPQAGHGSFTGIYHTAQQVTAATVHPYLQQPQTMPPGPVDMVVPSATVYQQTQHSQINWPNY